MTTAVKAPPIAAVARRIAVVDDHRLLSESLAHALSVHRYDVRQIAVPPGPSAPGALVGTILRIRPRVVVLDLNLGGFGDGIRLIEPLARADLRVVVLTGSTNRAHWGEAVHAGAHKVVPKTGPLSEVVAVVRQADRGLPLMGAGERDQLIGVWHASVAEEHDTMTGLAALSRREAEVLGQLMRGMNVRGAADLACVSEATVRTQVKAILSKLGVSSQVAAISLAHRVAWRAPGQA